MGWVTRFDYTKFTSFKYNFTQKSNSFNEFYVIALFTQLCVEKTVGYFNENLLKNVIKKSLLKSIFQQKYI